MRFAGYLAAGYTIVLGSLAAYAARIVAKGRRLARQVPVEEQRWR